MTPASQEATPSGGLPLLALPFAGLFVVSGACGLAYEVVWSRLLVHVFGVTAFAVSTVLVSFMGGMALGAALLGRRADRASRPLLMFAMLEAGIGVYALILPALIRGVQSLHASAFPVLPESFLLRSMVRFVFCLALLLVPTVLMGGTLPALGRGLLRRRGSVGLGVGLLYFVNTLGAAAGCYAAGFLLIPRMGLRGTTLLAAALNGVVALAAWLLERGGRAEPAAAEAPRPPGVPAEPPLTVPAWWPLAVAFGSGLTALAFEIVWFRILVLVFGSTVYSFSAMLAVFLLGLAIGSMIFGPLADRARSPARLLTATQGIVALTTVGGAMAVNLMPSLFLRLIRVAGLDFDGMNRTKLALSLVTLLPPALAFGGTFPVAVRLSVRRGVATGSRIGGVYAWNTVGAILGSFGAGFLLLPTIGAEFTLRLVVVVAVVLCLGSLVAEPGPVRVRRVGAVGAVLLVVVACLAFAPRWDRRLLGAGVYFEPQRFYDAAGRIRTLPVLADYEVTSYTEGYNETIISFRSPKGKFITVNGSTTASDHFVDMFVQRMLGHLPAALHPGPVRRALIVGLGSGVTAGSIAVYEEGELTAVELERGVFVASRLFEEENHHLLDRPSLDVRIDDGRNFLALTRERFDVISSAPNFPSLTGSGALYSKEYFELCRRRLAPGGVMCQTAPIWQIRPEEVRTVIGSFCDVFPHVRLFSIGLRFVLLGREEPFPPVDVEELSRRVARPEVRESLLGIGVRGPLELLSFYQCDEEEARRLSHDAPRNTDDAPRIEFFAPRGLFTSTVGPNMDMVRGVRPSREERARRLGLGPEDRASYLAFAAAYDAATDAAIALGQGRVQEAMRLAVPAAESGQRYARYLVADRYERTALALQRREDLEGAREAFATALRFEPERLDSLVGLGYVDLFLGRLDEAETALERAARLYPKSAGALYRLGLLREFQGRAPEAFSLYAEAVRLQPLLPQPHALLGRLLLRSERHEEAAFHLEEGYRLGERTEGVLVGRAEALLALGRTRRALVAAREAVERFPSSPEALESLARAAESAGRTEEAGAARRRRQQLPKARS